MGRTGVILFPFMKSIGKYQRNLRVSIIWGTQFAQDTVSAQ